MSQLELATSLEEATRLGSALPVTALPAPYGPAIPTPAAL